MTLNKVSDPMVPDLALNEIPEMSFVKSVRFDMQDVAPAALWYSDKARYTQSMYSEVPLKADQNIQIYAPAAMGAITKIEIVDGPMAPFTLNINGFNLASDVCTFDIAKITAAKDHARDVVSAINKRTEQTTDPAPPPYDADAYVNVHSIDLRLCCSKITRSTIGEFLVVRVSGFARDTGDAMSQLIEVAIRRMLIPLHGPVGHMTIECTTDDPEDPDASIELQCGGNTIVRVPATGRPIVITFTDKNHRYKGSQDDYLAGRNLDTVNMSCLPPMYAIRRGRCAVNRVTYGWYQTFDHALTMIPFPVYSH